MMGLWENLFPFTQFFQTKTTIYDLSPQTNRCVLQNENS